MLLHLEVALGDTTIALAERKPDWPETPALLQVWVRDAAATVTAARDRGSRVVTEPTPFFGDTLARFIDPFGNLWWLYQHDPTAAEWGGDAGWDESAGSDADAHASWEPTPELVAINTTLSEAMRSLRA